MHSTDFTLREAMQEIDTVVRRVVEEHEANQKLWMPTELIPQEHEFPELPPELAGMLTLNLLTEDGLPFFLALLVNHLGSEGAIMEWNCLWTAEEDRHGNAIQLYLQNSLSREQFLAIEKMQYDFIRNGGFWPSWSKDPYQLFAYVVMQEQATQLSHAKIAQSATNVDPVLTKIMGKIAGEEHKHHIAYLKLFEALFELDKSHGLSSLQKVIRKFHMPGGNIPHFESLATLQVRLEAYGPMQLIGIVNRLMKKLDVDNLGGLTTAGEKARDAIHRRIKALKVQAEMIYDAGVQTIHLPFLGKDYTVRI